jgi:hypothetical protein
MLPMNATPLNERLIQVLIEEHQTEIRRCFAPRSDGGRALPVRWLLRLLTRGRPTGELSTRQGPMVQCAGRRIADCHGGLANSERM